MDKAIKKSPNLKKIIKITTLLGVLFLMLFIMVKTVLFFTVIPKEIRELNNNIELPYKFASAISDYNLDTKQMMRKGGCYSFFDSSGNLHAFGGYPDVSSEYKYIGFRTTNSTIALFGISVGDDMNKAKQTLKNYGYKEKREYDDLYIYYIKGRVKIDFEGNKTVEDIQVELISTNWLMKQFK